MECTEIKEVAEKFNNLLPWEKLRFIREIGRDPVFDNFEDLIDALGVSPTLSSIGNYFSPSDAVQGFDPFDLLDSMSYYDISYFVSCESILQKDILADISFAMISKWIFSDNMNLTKFIESMNEENKDILLTKLKENKKENT